jgi:hypothetical protein
MISGTALQGGFLSNGDQLGLQPCSVAVFVSRSIRSRMHRMISLFCELPFRCA